MVKMSKKENLKVKILVGIPGSGKSTYCDEFLKNNSNYLRVSRDSFRFMLRNQPFCHSSTEDLITNLIDVTITKSLLKNRNLIIDNTNCKASYINHFIELVKHTADVEFEIFNVDKETCIQRDLNRQKSVGKDVINKMALDFDNLIKTFDFTTRKMIGKRPHIYPNFKSELPNAVIIDIDGTVAITGDRSVYDQSKVNLDIDNIIVSELVEFHERNNRKIIFVSGRDSKCRKETESWLHDNEIYFDELFMRKEGDNRKDTIIKTELYNKYIKDKYNVLCAIDDRLSVVTDTWNKLGIFTFCVNQGLIEF